jgi:putative transposase
VLGSSKRTFPSLKRRSHIAPISDWHVSFASIFSDMPQSLSRLLTHLIFSTKNRLPLLTPSIQSELNPYLAAILENFDCPSLQVGGVEDHVHILFGLSRTRSVAEVVETVKISSSKWIKTKGDDFAEFHWQSGYGAFSVSQSDVETVINYIRNQYDHHRKTSFQEEYRRFLERYKLQYDERYVWD